jgi:hypothetical protein
MPVVPQLYSGLTALGAGFGHRIIPAEDGRDALGRHISVRKSSRNHLRLLF